jgi:MoaA/NifB/PqqE/SkfB family radical SAM enzyme
MARRVLRLYAANGSVRAWGRLLRHAARGPGAAPVPVFFAVGLTYRCPCRCAHCYAHGRVRSAPDELTSDEVKHLLDDAAEMGALEAFFTGGEALLRPELPELIAHARRLGMLTRLSTNGYLLDEGRVEALAGAGLTQAGVSLDYADPAEHDRSRGLPGLHGRALAGISRLVAAGVMVQVHCVTFRGSIPAGVQALVALARERGAFGVCLIFPSASGMLHRARDEVLNAGERADVRALQDGRFVFAELPTPRAKCAAADHRFLYVNPYGHASPCTTVPYSMGNVRRTPLRRLWERYVEHVHVPCPGNCIMNDPAFHAELKERLAAVEAMEPRPPAA